MRIVPLRKRGKGGKCQSLGMEIGSDMGMVKLVITLNIVLRKRMNRGKAKWMKGM